MHARHPADDLGRSHVSSLAAHPHTMNNFGTFGTGNPGGFNAFVALGQVPDGFRYVVTYASIRVRVPAGQKVTLELTTDPSSAVGWHLPAIDHGQFNVSGANHTFVAAQQISVAFEPGATVGVRAFRSEAAPEAGQVTASVQGYLVEV
jgi:hypothetical protein